MSDVFEIDGIEFRLEPIPVFESMECYEHIAPIVGNFIVLAQNGEASLDGIAQALKHGSDAFRQLPRLRDFFLKHCSVKLPEYSGKWMPLAEKGFQDKAFPPRSHMRHTNWLVKCVSLEYGTFLDDLQSAAEVLAPKAENQSRSPSGSDGTSGE